MKSQNKKILSALSLICLMSVTSCGDKKDGETDKPAPPAWQSFEIQGSDTINKVDSKGLKQGPWFFYADKGKKAQKNVAPKLLVKGSYVDDKREGVWYYYSIETGQPSDTVVYRGDFPVEQ